jgi:hypothetical protein
MASHIDKKAGKAKQAEQYFCGEIKNHPSFTQVILVKDTGNTYNDPNTF